MRNVVEYRLTSPLIELGPEESPSYHTYSHPLLVIVSSPCDLESDHRSRHIEPPENERDMSVEDLDSIPARIQYTLVCDVFEEDTMRQSRTPGTDRKRFVTSMWTRIKKNQDERYHYLPEGTLGDEPIPALLLDFRRTMALPTEPLWEAIRSGQVSRFAVIPPIFVHDLAQRLYSFLSRFGTP